LKCEDEVIMSRTVLVVEDDFDTLHPLAEMLKLKGYSVITASDAERGLETARSKALDLIITDIVLPGKSGLHFIQSIRSDKRTAAIPIVVISGCGPMILVEAEASGANFCLEKPIVIEQFWATVEGILASGRTAGTRNVSESPDEGRALAAEIDRLVEALRGCASRAERETVLKQLKERILQFQMRKSNCA
jgi:DNA-binding response OmpR family regulator